MNSNFLAVLMLAVFLIGCSENKKPINVSLEKPADSVFNIPNRTVKKTDLSYKNDRSKWYLDGQLYSGWAIHLYDDSTVQEKFGILNGRKQNQAIQWYPDGHYRIVSNYHLGKLQGEKKMWAPDSAHTLLSQLSYASGKLHGEQRKWYPTGELYKILHLNMGKEEGLQRAFRTNGVLFANYEAKNGRIFGLKKANLCYSLEDESIYKEKD